MSQPLLHNSINDCSKARASENKPLVGGSGLIVVISSPSGVGKTTVSNRLLLEEKNIARSISVTTRKPRIGEVDGIDYHFVNNAKFDNMVANGMMLEHATVFGFRYGVPKNEAEKLLKTGIDVLFSIDWQGAFKLMNERKDDVVSIFLLPPSIQELESRIRKRGKDCDDTISKRLNLASFEMEKCFQYDYVIVNYDVDETVQKIRNIISSEKISTKRQKGLAAFLSKIKQECQNNV